MIFYQPDYSGMAKDKEELILVISINASGIPGSQVLNSTTGPAESMAKSKLPVGKTVDSHKDASSLSSLSVQLSQSAALAAARDSSLSRKELGAKATELLRQISGDSYFANKKTLMQKSLTLRILRYWHVRTMQRSL